MENFLTDPDYEVIRRNVIGLTQNENLKICLPFELDSIIFSGLLMKYSSGNAYLSFSSTEGCDLLLRNEASGRWIEFPNIGKYFLGKTSFSSLFSLSVNDILPILTGMMASAIQERRQLTETEKKMVESSQSLGVSVENSFKIPNYKQLPLFVSIMLSIDPYLPELTGNRENSIKLVKELGENETSKLEELNETQRNTLAFRMLASMSKYRQATSEDIIVSRIFLMEYDILEMAFASLLSLDFHGPNRILEMVFNPSFAETMIDEFRSHAMKGFFFDIRDEKNVYKVETNLKSPQLAHLIALQQKGKSKPVVIVDGGKMFSTKFFFPQLKSNGLMRIDNVN